ncbi:hypothetical protein PENTCL1PPCAC_11064 [Pristionchus entomophagus]|uniref:Gem-associated protein 2 n=1 Tax=Pristionchus entomophagus TaxID=358040 RepID=A0AAV5T5J1_9BILA|nr:hypothetical protein PENTCL1PPCAC_11064 [Pristionchus entomophagus]
MEPERLLPVPDNIDDVDTTVPPQSAEHYLAQVMASRRSCPMVVRSEVKRKAPPPSAAIAEDGVFDAPATAAAAPPTRNALAPSEEWVQAKVASFCANRDQLISQKEKLPKTKVEWPVMSDSQCDKWVSMAMEECAPEAKKMTERFPAHKGTPPAIPILAAMSTAQIHFLLCALMDDWLLDEDQRPDEQKPSGALLQWIHSLLLFADLPIMPDVSSSLRSFVRDLRTRRVTESDEATRLQYSSFIAITAHAFLQKDLAD